MTPRRHRITNRTLGAWHRRLGLGAAVFLIFLVVSGLLLNHSRLLGLNQSYIQSSWLLDWYGIHAPEEPAGIALGGRWLSGLDGRIYFDGRELSNMRGRLNGAVVLDHAIAAAVENDIWLLTPDGIVIERLGLAQRVPSGLRALGVDRKGRLVAQTAKGFYAADAELSQWRWIVSPVADWSRPMPVPPALRAELIRQYRGRGLSAERILADTHSGRLLGKIGVWLVDLTAVACLGLALSGLWLWVRRR
ncbi:MAG: PepSY domain-containing protein [Sulfuricaulis sp.]|uniref:PepSY domain-containing protein n=1 Tax=Sulfuricaulis sp. TaxID=2003553 RepID=UPI0025E0B7A6|nr:PepSY domain-containing protein [Sulfuricaulis sp.]MCR4346355.1 PepSY domain-containing protein [Sulfuricaulis sp.]